MDYTFIAERIVTLLEKHNITENALSLRLGRCKSYINKITSRKTYPSMEGFLDICEYFQITPEEFFSTRDVNDIEIIRQIHQDLKDLDPADLNLISNIILRLKGKIPQ